MLALAARSNAQLPSEPHVKVELISEQATSPPGQPLWVGLLFRLEPGWHIYWHNPGDSGEPPKVQWELPMGFVAGSIRWPQPIRLGGGSVVDYGYEGQVLLMAPIQGSSSRPSILCRPVVSPIRARTTFPRHVVWLTCATARRIRIIFQCFFWPVRMNALPRLSSVTSTMRPASRLAVSGTILAHIRLP